MAEAAAAHQKEKRSLEVTLQMSKAAVHELTGSTRDLQAELEDTVAEHGEQLRAVEAEISAHREAAEAAAPLSMRCQWLLAAVPRRAVEAAEAAHMEVWECWTCLRRRSCVHFQCSE